MWFSLCRHRQCPYAWMGLDSADGSMSSQAVKSVCIHGYLLFANKIVIASKTTSLNKTASVE